MGKYSGAYVISVVAIWSFSLSFFRIQHLCAINHAAAAPCREITTGASGNVDLMRTNVSLTFASPLVERRTVPMSWIGTKEILRILLLQITIRINIYFRSNIYVALLSVIF